ncbi:MAG: hypothetical protein P8Y45_04100 [Exilibacterium sp.]
MIATVEPGSLIYLKDDALRLQQVMSNLLACGTPCTRFLSRHMIQVN